MTLRTKAAIAVVVVVACGTWSSALGRVIYVDADAPGPGDGSSWGSAYRYLQDAIAAAAGGDEVRVAAGVYRPDQGTQPQNSRGATFRLVDGLRLRGGYAGFAEPVPDVRDIARYETILSGDRAGDDVAVNDPRDLKDEPSRAENCYNVVTAMNCDSGTVLDGFTITGGNANSATRSRDRRGGGIHDGNLTVVNCRIVGNYAVQAGGGCYGGATVRDCVISGNLAGQGGGLYGVRHVVNCTVTGNATHESHGGGIYTSSNDGTIENCSVIGNVSALNGGGIYIENCDARLSRCMVSGNSALQSGGGVYVTGSTTGGRPVIERCRIVGNTAGLNGGGLVNEGLSLTSVRSSVFVGNTAGGNGGGMCDVLEGGSSLVNCTFAHNVAADRGGGICYDSDPNLGRVITNSIVWYNSDSYGADEETSQVHVESGPAAIPYRYCNIEGWTGGGGGTGQVGGIGTEPRFVDPNGVDGVAGTADDNLRLQGGSPCIDAGDNSAVVHPARDLDGKVRIMGGVVDMGAYESDEGVEPEQPRYKVVDLGTLGGADSRALGVNDQGQVVGYSSTTDGQRHAFLWDQRVGLIDLGTLGGDTSTAYAINNLGQVVGSSKTAGNRTEAFIWENGRMESLGPFEGSHFIEAVAINDSGRVVGTADTASGEQAFLWDHGAMSNLGVLPGAAGSRAADINTRNEVVGTSGQRAFVLRATEGMYEPMLGLESEAYAINDSGQVALSSRGNYYVWDELGGLLEIDLVGPGRINAMNNSARVVGAFDHPGSGQVRAFVWDSGYGLLDLNTLMPPGSGFRVLVSAADISDQGLIVGHGITETGQEHAFLMSPIPADAFLVAHWRLDEAGGLIAEDSAGQNDGALMGNPRWEPYSGRMDGALAFDGDGDYVDCGSDAVFDITEQITLAAWVKINAVGAQWQAIVSKGDSAWRLSTVRDEMRFHFAVTGGPPWNYVNGQTQVGAGEWHHVCGTYDGTSMRLYVDGVEDPVGPVAESNGVQTNTYDVYIGANAERSNRYWDGLIDDVRVYNCSLRRDEVYELYLRAPVYVDADAPGANDGSSWRDAFRHVQDALAAAQGHPIHVAEGIYRPDQGAAVMAGDRDATFLLAGEVVLKGGFGGFGEPEPSKRDYRKYRSVLSGDLAGDDGPGPANNSENSRHVVTTSSNTESTTLLEGFTISGGNADGRLKGGGMLIVASSPTVKDCIFTNNRGYLGGAMYNDMGSPTIIKTEFIGNQAFSDEARGQPRGAGLYSFMGSPMLVDCIIAENSVEAPLSGTGDGGGVFSEMSRPSLVNCVLRKNSAPQYGGGMASWSGGGGTLVNCLFSHNSAGAESGGFDNYRDESTLVNCTFVDNSAPRTGGLYNEDGYPVLLNCIFWGNSDDNGTGELAQIRSVGGSLVVEYSCIEQWSRGGTGNINSAPRFEDPDGDDGQGGTADDNFRLTVSSLCIDAGDNTAVPVFVTTDLDGKTRIVHGVVDMGAYEYQAVLNWYVDGTKGNDNNNGLSPQTAFATINRGIAAAREGYTVVVYPGVYNEDVIFDRRGITVTGKGEDATILESARYAVSFYGQADPNSVLRNVVIRNCGIAGVLISGCSPRIENVTFVGNKYGIQKFDWGEPYISNCIFWGNTDGDLFGCQARYSCIQRAGEAQGIGNISAEPLFADAAGGDYHLLSERGRYRPATKEWILDDLTSPCVDAGDPSVEPTGERMPNGGRINMGAFGGTYYASMSEWKIAGDLNRDGRVNLADIALVARNWLSAADWAR